MTIKFRDKVLHTMAHESGITHEVAEPPIQLKGSVQVTVIEDGREWIHHENPNLIVNLARKTLSRLIAEVAGSDRINAIKLGRNGHTGDPTDPNDIDPPGVTDTTLVDGSPYSHALTSFSYLPDAVDTTSTRFVFQIEKAEGNGTGTEVYTEAGLFTLGDVLFARETFVALIKNSDRKFVFAWTILF